MIGAGGPYPSSQAAGITATRMPAAGGWSVRSAMVSGTRRAAGGFALIELLVVTGIVAALSAILLPALAAGRERARQSACASNMRQTAQAVLMYSGDFDDRFPSGLGWMDDERVWAGEGWAGQCRQYLSAASALACPDDPSRPEGAADSVVSYAYNINLVAVPGAGDQEYAPAPPGEGHAALSCPARTVMLFEVTGVLANVADAREGAGPGGAPGRNFSASANGLDHRLYAQRDWRTRIQNQYATGYLGGRVPPDPASTQYEAPEGRHSAGSSFVLCDGHAHWFRGAAVSSGLNALAPTCLQDNRGGAAGCGGPFRAAGAEAPRPAITFSIR